MPFVEVFGLPDSTPKEILDLLRRDIVQSLIDTMPGVERSWCRPFFPRDLLDKPTEAVDGAGTIFVRLDTGLFDSMSPEEADELAPKVTDALATAIWQNLSGRFEVECFVSTLKFSWRSLKHAET